MCKVEADTTQRDSTWLSVCRKIKLELEFVNDTEVAHGFIRSLSGLFDERFSYALDVGQSQVWAVQALELKRFQRVIMSAGLGSMGYALPAAIGAFYATGRPQVCIVGDGGFQMNIQELQHIAANNLPITIVLLNNNSLGMIRHFQEKNFESNYQITTGDSGYTTPSFKDVVQGYKIQHFLVTSTADLQSINVNTMLPQCIEVVLPEKTYLGPAFGIDLAFDQIPKIDRDLFNLLMAL